MYSLTHHTISLLTEEYIREFHHPEKFIQYCQQCNRYNHYWSCPPFSFNPKNYLSGYRQAYIIGSRITFDPLTRASCVTMEQHHEISLQTIEAVRKTIDPQLLRLEQLYPGSKAFYAGICHLCPAGTCTRTDHLPCRHPQEIRPSLEALGFDINRTSAKLLHIELQWSNNAQLPEYLMLVSGFFTNSFIHISRYF